ncbi:nuclear transport factor 2 family protein [Sphingomonas sp. 28-63-12]|uniref:nuclear transport factor 2 family protein n=1 Tax=Sphingomonas sp. 28-63-12 TaxID=1970434 RepID=UPI0035A84173
MRLARLPSDRRVSGCLRANFTPMTDHDALQALKARYCRLLDTKDWAGFADLFTEDAVLDVTADTGQPPFCGRGALIAAIQHAVAHARTAHHVHSPEITVEGDRATAIWAMQDRVIWDSGQSPIPPHTGITGYGHYHETYRRADSDNWRIASLTLTRLLVEMDD